MGSNNQPPIHHRIRQRNYQSQNFTKVPHPRSSFPWRFHNITILRYISHSIVIRSYPTLSILGRWRKSRYPLKVHRLTRWLESMSAPPESSFERPIQSCSKNSKDLLTLNCDSGHLFSNDQRFHQQQCSTRAHQFIGRRSRHLGTIAMKVGIAEPLR